MPTQKHNPSTPKHVFTHILLLGVLCISVISLIQLLFVYIDLSFFDPLTYTGYWNASNNFSIIRWTSSVLIVCGPLFVLLHRSLYNEISNTPELQHFWVRRWLLTFTLFVSAITIIGSLIAVIYNFYNGELTAPFTLKVATLLFLAAAIFGYFRWDMQRVITGPSMIARYSGVALLTSIAIAIIVGFFIAGSPQHQRNVLLDEQRVSDLQTIQGAISQYYGENKKLPATLADLKAAPYYVVAPLDPKTQTAYEYLPHTDLNFELCATFSTKSTAPSIMREAVAYDGRVPGYLTYTDDWVHNAARTCFSRTIDPSTLSTPGVK